MAVSCVLDERGLSYLSRNRFVSSARRLNRQWSLQSFIHSAPSALSPGKSGRGLTLTVQVHQRPWSRMYELELKFRINLHGTVNFLKQRTNLLSNCKWKKSKEAFRTNSKWVTWVGLGNGLQLLTPCLCSNLFPKSHVYARKTV
jgi:hypothetical protein